MRHAMINALHKGHPGRDAMLASIDEYWWPEINRQIIATAKICTKCQRSGKNIKVLKRQKQFGKLPEVKNQNEEVAIDFIGPFLEAPKGRKYILVAVDHFSSWPTLKFVKNTDFSSVEKFLTMYIVDNGIPIRLRTDQASVFHERKFKEFCENQGIKHVICPSADHRGNGKVERLIRTVNERVRAEPQIVKNEKEQEIVF